jgi:aminoglycoside phosphotransferase (APT) family kinase protein
MADSAQAKILSYLAKQGVLPADADCRFTLLSGGNSHITWRLQSEGHDDLVAKVAQPDGPLAPYDVAHEAAMMLRARALGAAVPEVVGHFTSASGECDFVVMKHVAGEAPSIWDVPEWLEAREPGFRMRVGRNLVASLKPLQRLPDGGDLPSSYDSYLTKVADTLHREVGDAFVLPHTVDKAGAWLRARCVELDAPAALYHGDFRLGNVVVRDGEVAALLDWERAMIGHPLHDIGYFCLPGMRTGDLLCGLVTQSELAAIWREEIGAALDLRLCAYFRIMAMYTEFCAMVQALARLAHGRGRLVGARTLPLVASLHYDLLVAIREWDDGRFHL